MKHGILQSKTARRGTRRLLCLLLAIMMTAGDMTMPFATAADANSDFYDNQTYTQTICEWKRVTKRADLPGEDDKLWHPILISYTSGGTEYFFNASSRTEEVLKKEKQGVLTDNWKLTASKWSDQMAIYRCPSLSDANIKTFATVGSTITDIGIRFASSFDDENRDEPTYLVGRNIDWYTKDKMNVLNKESAAKQKLMKYTRNQANFDETGSAWYYNCLREYPGAYDWWSFVTSDSSTEDYYNWHLNKGEVRIVSIADYAWDTCLYYEGNEFRVGNFATMDYANGTFNVWIGTVKNLPTLNGDFTIQANQVLNLDDDVMIKEGATLKVMPGASLTIDATLYNNGTIINYGTIFLLEGGCIRTLCPTVDGKASQNCGKIICSGSEQEGEGNLVAFENSSIVFDEGANLFKVESGAVVELNGRIVCPNTFILNNADIHIREKGMLICQYAMRSNFLNPMGVGIYAASAHDGPISVMSHDIKEMNRSQVPVPYITTGSCLFTNDGLFVHQTKPTNAAAIALEQEQSELQKKYFSTPVWTESVKAGDIMQVLWGNAPVAYYEQNAFYVFNLAGSLSIPCRGYGFKYEDDFINVDSLLNTNAGATTPAKGQNPNSFRGELVEYIGVIYNSKTKKYERVNPYEAFYLLDSSGWYTVREITDKKININTLPTWASARSQEAWDTKILNYSYRRLYDSNGTTLIKEGHYDPVSDTFITYNYQTKIKYVEMADGSMEAYSFTGNPGAEKDGEFLAGKLGSGYVDLRSKF